MTDAVAEMWVMQVKLPPVPVLPNVLAQQQQAAQTGAQANYTTQADLITKSNGAIAAVDRNNRESMRAAAKALIQVLAPGHKNGGGSGAAPDYAPGDEPDDEAASQKEKKVFHIA